MAKEENSSPPVAPNSLRKTAVKSKYHHKNRVEFRVPNDELWIYESVAKLLFEHGYIPDPNINEAARFSFRLYARDYVTRGDLLTKNLSGVIPITYYDKLVKELDSEKQLRMLYETANETFASLSKAQCQPIDNPITHLKPGEEEYRVQAFPNASQASTAKVQASEKALKGRFVYFPALRAGGTADDYKGRLENSQA